MKILKTNKLLLAIFYSNLRGLKTEQFKTDDEMEQYRNKLKPTLMAELKDYCDLWEDTKNIQRNFAQKKITEVEVKKAIANSNNKFAELDVINDGKEISLELEDADFNLFFDFFGTIGKKSFSNIDQYLDFKEQLNATNMQPKDKKVN